MASNCRHLPVGRSLGWIAFIVEKSQEPMSVEQTRSDHEAGFLGKDRALVLTESGQSEAEMIMGQRHVMRQSDSAQAMFGRFFIAPLIEQGHAEPVMTGGIIVIDLQLSVESGLSLLPFSQF